ncbi:MAG: ABC transporter ATP-binding protein [Spirochaetia bacterium]
MDKSIIHVTNLSYTYPGNSITTVENISFSIRKGEIFGFLGPSGAGKSTTQKILIGILKDYTGAIQVLGREIVDWGRDLYEKIGIAFETPNFYDKFTAYENLRFFSSLYRYTHTDISEVLEKLGLGEHKNKRYDSFSKGMKMRLNLCRAMLHNPDLYFLDEPTSGLDPVNARNVKDLIRSEKEAGKTVFLTTHNMGVAEELCDRLAFLVDGRIVLIDSPASLKVIHGKKTLQIQYKDSGNTAVQEFPLQDISSNKGFLQILKEKQIETMHTQDATMEDIFIKTTGRGLQ